MDKLHTLHHKFQKQGKILFQFKHLEWQERCHINKIKADNKIKTDNKIQFEAKEHSLIGLHTRPGAYLSDVLQL